MHKENNPFYLTGSGLRANDKRPGGMLGSFVFFYCYVCPYGRLIASFGQTLAHVPHSVQRSGSME